MRTVFGWIFGILGLVIILAIFGIDFGVHGPFGTPIANALLGGLLILLGFSLAHGWAPWNKPA